MTKKTILILFLFAAFFVAGFFSGIFMKDTSYKTVQAEFNQQLNQLKYDLEAAELVTERFDEISKTLEEKNEEIIIQSELIQKKEAELKRLKKKLSLNSLSQKEKKEIEYLTNQLADLQKEFDKISFEAKKAQEELAQVNNELRLKNEEILSLQTELNSNTTNKNSQVEKEELVAKKKTSDYEHAAKFEFKADNYSGKKKKKNKDQNYFNAYFFYKKADAKIDMRRVKSKIKSKEIRHKINSGNFKGAKK